MQCEISEAIDMVLSDPVKVNKDSSFYLLHTTKAHLPAFSLCVVCEPFPFSLSLTEKSGQWSCHMCSRVVVVCQILLSEVSISQFLLLSGCHPSPDVTAGRCIALMTTSNSVCVVRVHCTCNCHCCCCMLHAHTGSTRLIGCQTYL